MSEEINSVRIDELEKRLNLQIRLSTLEEAKSILEKKASKHEVLIAIVLSALSFVVSTIGMFLRIIK